jgi:hypothetical protein
MVQPITAAAMPWRWNPGQRPIAAFNLEVCIEQEHTIRCYRTLTPLTITPRPCARSALTALRVSPVAPLGDPATLEARRQPE